MGCRSVVSVSGGSDMVRVRRASEAMPRRNLAERLIVSGGVNFSQTSIRNSAQQQMDENTTVGSVCMHAINQWLELF